MQFCKTTHRAAMSTLSPAGRERKARKRAFLDTPNGAGFKLKRKDTPNGTNINVEFSQKRRSKNGEVILESPINFSMPKTEVHSGDDIVIAAKAERKGISVPAYLQRVAQPQRKKGSLAGRFNAASQAQSSEGYFDNEVLDQKDRLCAAMQQNSGLLP